MRASKILCGVLLMLAGHLLAQAPVQEAWVRQFVPTAPQKAVFAGALVVDRLGHVHVGGVALKTNVTTDYLAVKYDGEGNPQWTNIFNSNFDRDDDLEALTVDALGYVYLTGESEGKGEFTDFVTLKLNSKGEVQWLARYDGPAQKEDDANAIAVDGRGNVYVTGASMNSGAFPTTDYATVAYDAAGKQLWVARYDGPGNNFDEANAIAVDAQGNVYVTGFSRATSGPRATADFTTIKYSPTGGQLWVARYNGPGNGDDIAVDLALDAAGNVIVTGSSAGAGTGIDIATIKYGNDGKELWSRRYHGPANGDDQPHALAVDAEGFVYVTGYANAQRLSTQRDYITIKYAADGTEQWAALYDGPGKDWDEAHALAVDAAGNVYVTGQSAGEQTTGADYATLKYNRDGKEMWVARYSSEGKQSDGAADITVDASGNVYVTGTTQATAETSTIITIKYTQAAVVSRPQLAKPTNGSGDQPLAVMLQWHPLGGAVSYRLQVSTDPQFATLLLDETLTDTAKVVGPLANNTVYYWRVSAKLGDGSETAFSEAWQFTTIPTAPAAPLLSSPANGATNVTVPVTLAWQETAGAATYHVQVADVATFANPLVDDATLSETSVRLTSLNHNTTYFWRVQAANSGGIGPWSETWSFTTAATSPTSFNLTGKVAYCATGAPIAKVEMTLTDGVVLKTTTDSDGNYSFEKLAAGLDYTVTPAKSDDFDPASISCYDAALIARLALGLNQASLCDSLAADVDENGAIRLFDAALTCRYALGLPPFGTAVSHVGQWRFQPSRREYPALNADHSDQNFTATLLGEVDGNWKPASDNAGEKQQAVTYPYWPDLMARPGEMVQLPLMAGEPASVLAVEVDFSYNPEVLQFIEVKRVGLSEKFDLLVNSEAGRLRVGAFTANAERHSGELLSLCFQVIGAEGEQSPLQLHRYQMNGGAVQRGEASLLVGATTSTMPKAFALGQNYPNPFNPETVIRFDLPASDKAFVRVQLAIYDVAGRLVRLLVDQDKPAGSYEVRWDGRDQAGKVVPSSAYFYRLVAGDFTATRKMAVIR